MRTPLASASGFTLLELVVGIVIAMTAVLLGYAAFGALMSERTCATPGCDRLAAELFVRSELRAWLGSAVLHPERIDASFQGVRGDSAQRRSDRLSFVSNASTLLGGADAIVQLRIVPRDSAPYGLVASITPLVGEDARSVVLDSAATDMQIRYFSRVQGQTEWLDSWISATVLPAGVEIRLNHERDRALPQITEPLVVMIETGR